MSDEEQKENLERVTSKIAPHVMAFLESIVSTGRHDFHMEELREWVQSRVPETAPNSPYRIFYELREHGATDYEIVNRRESHYVLTRLRNQTLETKPHQSKKGAFATPREAEAAISAEVASRWLVALRKTAKKAGVPVDPDLVELGHWLKARSPEVL